MALVYTSFPLFRSHLDLAHRYWEEIVQVGDTVIDATCGNGNDTLKLAQLALNDTQGYLIGFDIQDQAILSTRNRLAQSLTTQQMERIQLICGCHSNFPPVSDVKLIVYNLGYLPKGDKAKTTTVETTLESLRMAMDVLAFGGLISITCYPGHAEGEKEESALLNFIQTLDPQVWCCTYQQWINRQKSPGLLLIQKKCSSS